MFNRIREDIQTVFAEDPAAKTIWEVLCCYPGLHAIWLHRIACFLWGHKLFFLGRLVSHANRWLTGVEVHPGASIGRRFFIDHGMGVVIGETSEIGDDVLIYQGVVLGGTRLEKKKRHPTIGDGVVIGAGATILGPINVGRGARIGAGSVVVKAVPAGATIVGVPGRIAGAESTGSHAADLEHGRLPDPVLRTISEALGQQIHLEERVQQLERALARVVSSPDSKTALNPIQESDIRESLRRVIEPEIGINIVDLGMVKEITLNGRGIEVRMVLACPQCPYAGQIVDQVRHTVRSVAGDEPVEVVLVDEAWAWSDAAPRLMWGDGI